jgi:hypothetical protein
MASAKKLQHEIGRSASDLLAELLPDEELMKNIGLQEGTPEADVFLHMAGNGGTATLEEIDRIAGADGYEIRMRLIEDYKILERSGPAEISIRKEVLDAMHPKNGSNGNHASVPGTEMPKISSEPYSISNDDTDIPEGIKKGSADERTYLSVARGNHTPRDVASDLGVGSAPARAQLRSLVVGGYLVSDGENQMRYYTREQVESNGALPEGIIKGTNISIVYQSVMKGNQTAEEISDATGLPIRVVQSELGNLSAAYGLLTRTGNNYTLASRNPDHEKNGRSLSDYMDLSDFFRANLHPVRRLIENLGPEYGGMFEQIVLRLLPQNPDETDPKIFATIGQFRSLIENALNVGYIPEKQIKSAYNSVTNKSTAAGFVSLFSDSDIAREPVSIERRGRQKDRPY